jgi:hypothetical protein
LQCWVRHLKIPTIPCIIIIIIVLPIEIVWYSYTLGTLGYNLTLRTDPTMVLWVLFLSLGHWSNWSTFFSCPDRSMYQDLTRKLREYVVDPIINHVFRYSAEYYPNGGNPENRWK